MQYKIKSALHKINKLPRITKNIIKENNGSIKNILYT